MQCDRVKIAEQNSEAEKKNIFFMKYQPKI